MEAKVTQRVIVRYEKGSVEANEIRRFTEEMKKVGIAVVALEFKGSIPQVELLAGSIQENQDVRVHIAQVNPVKELPKA